MFVLDTDVFSNLRKQKPHPLAGSWLLSLPEQEATTTVISVAEIQCGIAILLAKMHETRALRNFLIRDPQQKGTKSGADLAIAAIAISHRATLATGNQSHFLEIDRIFPLPGLYNPFTCTWAIRRPA